MGIQINGSNDTISATDGGLSISGQSIDNADLNLSQNLNVTGVGTFGNRLNVGVGGTTITTTSAGLVGIGTTNPAVKTHISDSVSSTGATGTEILRIANTRLNTGSSAVALRFVNNEISGTNQYTRAQIAAEYDGSSNNNGRLMFATADTSGNLIERARIDGSGNLGIGTVSPSTLLHITGSGGLVKLQRTVTYNNTWNIFQSHTGTGTYGTLYLQPSLSTADIVFYNSSNSDVVRMGQAGDVTLSSGNLVIGTSGKGIDFSATANSSGTMTSELLADYEEGTWTPGISFGGGTTGITYSTQSGFYTKIGNTVTIWVYILLSSKGSSTGDARITNLPFTNANSQGRSEGSTFAVNYWNNFASAVTPCGYVQNNTTTIYLTNVVAATASSTLPNTVWNNTSSIFGCATYSVV